MATLRDWAVPFLEQAKEDLAAAHAVYTHAVYREVGSSTFCMLLQMIFEKLGKAAFARRTRDPAIREPPHTHQTASKLLLQLARYPGGLPIPGLQLSQASLFSAIQELEDANPETVKKGVQRGLARWPQLEFPWENPQTGAIEWPAQHLPIAKRVQNPRDRVGADLLKFAGALVHQFDTLFP